MREKELRKMLFVTCFFTIFFSFFNFVSALLAILASLLLYNNIKKKNVLTYISFYTSIIVCIYILRIILISALTFIIIYVDLNTMDYRTLTVDNNYFAIEYKTFFGKASAENIILNFLDENNTFEFKKISDDYPSDVQNFGGIYILEKELKIYYYIADINSDSYFKFKSVASDQASNYFLKKEVMEMLKKINIFEIDFGSDIVIDEENSSKVFGYTNMFTYEILDFWDQDDSVNYIKFDLKDLASLRVGGYTLNTSDKEEILEFVRKEVDENLIVDSYFEDIRGNNYYVIETNKSREMDNFIYVYVPKGSSSYGTFDFLVKKNLVGDDQIFVDANIRYTLDSLNDEYRN